jgi:hypothetical protein
MYSLLMKCVLTYCNMTSENGTVEPKETAAVMQWLDKHVHSNGYAHNNAGTVGSSVSYAVRAEVI